MDKCYLDTRPISFAWFVQPTNFLWSACVSALSDTHLLCFQVTPAPCRLSWSWRKLCVSMNLTKTLSSLSTVSLAPPHTQSIYNTHCFFISVVSDNSTCVSRGDGGLTCYIVITIIYSHSLPRTFTQKSWRWAKARAALWPLCARGVSSYIDMKESTKWRQTGKLKMQWGCTCLRSAECQEVRRLRECDWEVWLYTWLRTVESLPSARYVLLLKKIMCAGNRRSSPLRFDC